MPQDDSHLSKSEHERLDPVDTDDRTRLPVVDADDLAHARPVSLKPGIRFGFTDPDHDLLCHPSVPTDWRCRWATTRESGSPLSGSPSIPALAVDLPHPEGDVDADEGEKSAPDGH